MKKIFFLLLFPFISFSQVASDESINLKLLEYYEKQDVFSYEVRDLLKEKTNEILIKTSSPEVKQKAENLLKYYNNLKTAEGIKVDLTLATKEDLKKFYKTEDKFEKSIRLEPKRLKSNRLFLKIDIKNNLALIPFTIKYNAKDWIFLNSITFLVNDEKLSFILKDVQRDTYLGGINESSSFYLKSEDIKIFKKIANSNSPVYLRYYGDKGSQDITLNKYMIDEIKSFFEFLDKITVSN